MLVFPAIAVWDEYWNGGASLTTPSGFQCKNEMF